MTVVCQTLVTSWKVGPANYGTNPGQTAHFAGSDHRPIILKISRRFAELTAAEGY